MKSSAKIVVKASPADCADYVQQQLISDLQEAIAKHGRALLVLAGGSTPKLLYEKLATLPQGQVDWSKVVLLWGDERNVPADHADSNYRMVCQAWLDKMPPDQRPKSYRIPTGDLSAAEAAQAYERTLKELRADQPLKLDVVLLGIGDDAHTASLFPETQALYCKDRAVCENWVEKLNTWRVTLTFDALNAATKVYFLVCGQSKTPALKQILKGVANVELYPAQGVQPREGSVEWVLDQAAANGL